MKDLTKKLNRLMNDNLQIWALATGIGAAVNPVVGLGASAQTLNTWLIAFNNFKEDEYAPGLEKSRRQYLDEVYR